MSKLGRALARRQRASYKRYARTIAHAIERMPRPRPRWWHRALRWRWLLAGVAGVVASELVRRWH
jgi:hypothetical protein